MTFRNVFAVSAAILLCACASTAAKDHVVVIPALRETPPVGIAGDAADDPAIWVAPDPAQSRIVGTQKQGGLFVYDLSGAVVQDIPGGRPNNIDMRDGFAWREGSAPIFAASDRADNSITLWRLDPAAGRLDTQPRARIATGWAEVYGVCLGRMGADFIVLATSKVGDVKIWRIGANAGTADLLGGFALGSIAEGCVIDDHAGAAYVSQELVGLWRFSLTRPNGDDKRLVDRVGGHLVADVEGVTLWDGGGGRGYVVVSVQRRSHFAVYDRGGENAYRGAFRIGPAGDGAIDGVSGTDGLDISAANLGPAFSRGLIVAQDDENTLPAATQDFKYASWADVEAALGLAP